MKSSNSFSLIRCWESLPGVVLSCSAGQGRPPYSACPSCSSFIPEGSKPTCCTKPGDSAGNLHHLCWADTTPQEETLPLLQHWCWCTWHTHPKMTHCKTFKWANYVLNLAVTALSSVFLAVLKWFKVLLIHLSYPTRDLLGRGKQNGVKSTQDVTRKNPESQETPAAVTPGEMEDRHRAVRWCASLPWCMCSAPLSAPHPGQPPIFLPIPRGTVLASLLSLPAVNHLENSFTLLTLQVSGPCYSNIYHYLV